MDQNDLAAMAAQALFSVLGGAASTAASQFTQDRLNRSARGRAALDGLNASPGDPAAQRDVQAALTDEISGDSEFADRLAVLLHAPVQQTTGSVVITGSRVRHNQIALGPLTINNTPGTRAFLAFAVALLLVLVVLGAYGGVQIITADDEPKAQPQATGSLEGGEPTPRDSDGGEGRTDGPRVMTAAEADAALPTIEDMPPDWGVFDDDRHLYYTDHELKDCYADGTMFDTDAEDGDGIRPYAWFRIYACSSPARAAAAFDEFGPTSKVTAILLPSLGDERTAWTYGGDSESATSLVRMGTVVLKLDYAFGVRLQPAHQDRIKQWSRMAAERVQRTLAST
ncbi:hypothetical protein [Streptomyces rishiriensis]|uniref:Uncharacterized protein n=1 Tax=Streptomyces rishiriensis TaxID=68264 RepID=A0ABU0NHG7_STRRH|nr:hypothetical protein [Streptomyces rishiriensis]MDQ0578572.1 hypothetical protein [Streptomyces rishiriensis]